MKIHENNNFRSYREDQRGNEYRRCTINRCTARLKTFTVGEVVELISYHTHADTVYKTRSSATAEKQRVSCPRQGEGG